MKNGAVKNIIVSVAVICLVAIVTAVAAFAWFTSGGGGISDSLVVYSGTIGINVGVYNGLDFNKDGALNVGVYDGNGNLVYAHDTYDQGGNLVGGKSSRATIVSYLYSELSKENGIDYDDSYAGTSIMVKVIAENPSTATTDATVSIALSDLGEYFFQAIGLSDEQQQQLFKTNSARIMFKLQNLVARVYGADTGENAANSFTEGYSTLIRSSVLSEQTASVTAESLTDTSYYLWEISSGERFVSGINLNRGELVEIDFDFYCMDIEEIYQNYSIYWDNYVTTNGLTGTDATDITSTCQSELTYIVSDDLNNNLELNFTISKLYVFGEQKLDD